MLAKAAATVAVNVTVSPKFAGFSDDVRVVVVAGARSYAPMSTIAVDDSRVSRPR